MRSEGKFLILVVFCIISCGKPVPSSVRYHNDRSIVFSSDTIIVYGDTLTGSPGSPASVIIPSKDADSDKSLSIAMIIVIVALSVVALFTCVHILRMRFAMKALTDEKNALKALSDSGVWVDIPTMSVINRRLSLLNKVLAAEINHSLIKDASLELEKVLDSKDEFIISTASVFAASYPQFVGYLRECGLTEWETGFCCLYLMGLKGKDVKAIVKNAYNINSVIRTKFKLSPVDTNLDIYLKDLFQSYYNEQANDCQ